MLTIVPSILHTAQVQAARHKDLDKSMRDCCDKTVSRLLLSRRGLSSSNLNALEGRSLGTSLVGTD